MILRRSIVSQAALSAAFVVATAAGCQQSPGDSSPALPAETVILRFFKDPAPVARVTVRALDGRTMLAADWAGKVVLVNFWATWCAPCKAEIPDLVALQEKYRDELLIVGIAEDEGSPEPVRAFAVEHGVNYPIVMSTPELREAFPGVHALPTSFVIDREGRIVQRHVGLLDAATTEYEVRSLAGLPVNAAIELVDPSQPIALANAAQVRDIPGIDLSRLSPEKRVATVLRLNAEPCTCGCELTVARCRVEDQQCPVSLPLAQKIASEIAAQP